ncbi:hypothetical protein BC828DRAFT_401777 [Blastocladiella britannica]|nr:hypothetical protein BC828DRAFT_401777 [Blastocladiella britannica]
MKSALDVVHVSTFLELSVILALRAASRCLVNLTPVMLEHDPATRALMAIVKSCKAKSADVIFRAPKNLVKSRILVRQVVHRLVCCPHRNRRYSLRLNLLHGFFQVSPPTALHLQHLVGLTGPDWAMGVIADSGSTKGYALEMYSAMLNFGTLEVKRLDATMPDVAHAFMDLANPLANSADMEWTRNAADSALMPDGFIEGDLYPLADTHLPEEIENAPPGGLTWILSHLRSSDLGIVSFASVLLHRIIRDEYVPLDNVFDHPGIASGLVQALSLVATSDETNTQPAWQVAEQFVGFGPDYLHSITGSDFLRNVATGRSESLLDYDVAGAAVAFGALHGLASTASVLPGIAHDIANAAERSLLDGIVFLVQSSLEAWCGDAAGVTAKLAALQSLPNELLLVKSNLHLMMAVIGVLSPHSSGTDPSTPLLVYRQRIVDAVASTCPRYGAGPSTHDESPCARSGHFQATVSLVSSDLICMMRCSSAATCSISGAILVRPATTAASTILGHTDESTSAPKNGTKS